MSASPGDDLPADAPDDASLPPGAIAIPPRRPSALYRALGRWLLRVEARLQSTGSFAGRARGLAVWVLVLGLALFLLFGPVLARPPGVTEFGVATADAYKWTAHAFEAEYTVVRTDDGRVRMDVVETFRAEFPVSADDLRIDRILPVQRGGTALAVTVHAVTRDGVPARTSTSAGPFQTTITIDETVPGERSSVVTIAYSFSMR